MDGGTVQETEIKSKAKDYPYQTLIRLEATPDFDDWEFVRWKGDLESFNNVDTVSVESKMAATAYFGSYDDIPYDQLESKLYALYSGHVYNKGIRVIEVGLSLKNGMNIPITLKRITIVSHDRSRVSDHEFDQIISSGYRRSYDLLLRDFPTLEQFAQYKVYWEFQINDSQYIRIKIGTATDSGTAKREADTESITLESIES